MKEPWISQKTAYQDALTYLHGRREGSITSFKTPWDKVNDAGVNGFEWQTLTVIGGRPGTGKTLIKDQIIREAFTLNIGYSMRVLEFSLEMVSRASKVREFCAILGKPYKYVCSAYEDDKLTDVDFKSLYTHAKKSIDIDKYPVDIIENPCTVVEFISHIHKYMAKHALVNEDGKKIYVNTVITLDHSILLKTGKGEKNKTDMLYNLGAATTMLKRIYPIAFIVLSQLGRHVEAPERNEDGKYGNYILETDIFGGDALMQHADMVIGINRPAMKFIQFYGPDRYIIADDSVLVFHFIKVRNGDVRMSFFKAEFDKMKITEMPTPGNQQQRVSTNV